SADRIGEGRVSGKFSRRVKNACRRGIIGGRRATGSRRLPIKRPRRSGRDPLGPCFPLLARRHAVPRTLLCCAALAAFGPPAPAEQTVTSTETVIRLTVQPMAAPKPALRYLLLPELKEMNPGNPIESYLRCFADLSVPEQPVFGASALRQADAAARLDTPDWHILLQLKTGGFGL